MNREHLLSRDYLLSDRLDPSHVDAVSTASLLLETPRPRNLAGSERPPSRSGSATHRMTERDRAEAANARRAEQEREDAAEAHRAERIAESLRLSEGLLETSSYDISVMTLYLRATVEQSGMSGSVFALKLLLKLLGRPWQGLEAPDGEDGEASTGRERGRVRSRRRWSGHLDAVFEQMFTRLSRAPEELRSDGVLAMSDWAKLRTELSARISERGLRPSRWEAIALLLDEMSRHQRAPDDESMDEQARGAPGGEGIERHLEGNGAATTLAAERAAPREVTLRISAQFVLLQERLAAFASLLQARQYLRASLVAEDIQNTLEAFDAPTYFPGLFAEFFVGCAEHAGELSQFGSGAGDPRWQALTRLYRTDLERFLALERPGGEAGTASMPSAEDGDHGGR